MSTLLDSVLDIERLADCQLHEPDSLPIVTELDLAAWLQALLELAVQDLIIRSAD